MSELDKIPKRVKKETENFMRGMAIACGLTILMYCLAYVLINVKF